MNLKTYKNFCVDTDVRGVTTIELDVPDRPMNVLTQEVMDELEQIVSGLERAINVHLVVIRSGKDSGFLAGADVNVIAAIDSDTQANSLIQAGQSLFARIESLPMPKLVVIHGVCLGGGLELALACNYRIARDNSSTQIGLPEIKLGVIPGWGGTQRLPRLVGMSTALSLILQGELVDARKAAKAGLIDLAIAPDEWDVGVTRMIDNLLNQHAIAQAQSRMPLWQRVMDRTQLGRWFIRKNVLRSIASKTKHYPALDSAMRAVELSFDRRANGYEFEREQFVELLKTPTCHNLLNLFFAREKARQLKTWSDQVPPTFHDEPIRKVGVVGAGAMGAGIGQLAAYRGFDVVLKEVNVETMEAGRQRVESLVDELVKRKHMSEAARSELMNRIQLSCEEHPLADVDLVIEAVVEREDVKAQVFQTLDKVVKKSAILASNTSSLSVTRMAESTVRREKVAGLHFFNPVHRMELVEVVRTAESDDASISRLVAFVRALGKTPVVTSDSPGFLVNRVLFPYLGEAVVMVSEGFDIEQIDCEIRRFGMPMGPLELLDQVGIDVAHHVSGSLDKILPGVGTVVQILDTMVDAGHLGKKTGQGFYLYRKGKKGKAAAIAGAQVMPLPVSLVEGFQHDSLTPIQRRLVYPMLAEAIRCLDERVVSQPWAINLGMVLGTGFAPHLGGPLGLVESITPEIVLANIKRLQFYFGERFAPPKHLIEMVERGEKFFAVPHSPTGVLR